MEYLAAILSPNSVSSKWVQEELQQAMEHEISRGRVKILPILLQDCDMPGFLRSKLYADFRKEDNYESSLQKLLDTLGVNRSTASGSRLYDPFAERYQRVTHVFARPKFWYCIYCGSHQENPNSSNRCISCHTPRPFAGASTTMIQCYSCDQWSIAEAKYCEWCGVKIDHAKMFIKWFRNR
jgi:hypothetical protein